MSKPAARVNDSHDCSKDGHGGGAIVEGSSNIFIENQPVARVGDKAKCNDGSDNEIKNGSATVFFNGKPAARVSDALKHGGKISSGASKVFIGSGGGRVGFGNFGRVGVGGLGRVGIGGQPISPESVAHITCPVAWSDINQKANAIASIQNPTIRNKKISAAYAKIYKKNPKLKWAGTAAFASKQVGCGMTHTLTYGHEGGKEFYNALGNGNKAVFTDIYPALVFFTKFGMEKLMSCSGNLSNAQIKAILPALTEIEEGNLKDGNETILRHEQKDILQKMYNKPLFHTGVLANHELTKITNDHYGEPEKVSFTANCQGGQEVHFEGTDLADFDQRWPFAKQVADEFSNLSNTDYNNIQQQLTAIIAEGDKW